MLNKIILIGRLTFDPELRYTTNGIAVSNFTLAVERPYKNKNGENDVDFIKIVAWRKLAETCAHNLGKGRLVAVEGSLQINEREKDGRTYINPEVNAQSVRFLDWPDKKKSNQNEINNKGEDDDFEIPEDFDAPF